MKKGDKVVCVDDSVSNPRVFMDFDYWPKQGETYTVRNLNPSFGGLLLEELVNPPIHIEMMGGKTEPRFAVSRFRKIEQKPEVEALTEELENVMKSLTKNLV